MDVLQLGAAETRGLMQQHFPAREHLPCLPLAALILSHLRTETMITPHVLTELGSLFRGFVPGEANTSRGTVLFGNRLREGGVARGRRRF